MESKIENVVHLQER